MKLKQQAWIEVEVKNLEEVKQAVSLKVERILLDNMKEEEIVEALKHIPSFIEVEVSGNMTVKRVKRLSKLPIHFISVGAITHSAPSMDLSLLFE